MFRGPESGEVFEHHGQRIRQILSTGVVGYAEIHISDGHGFADKRSGDFESYDGGDLDLFCREGYCKAEMLGNGDPDEVLMRPGSLQHIPKGTRYKLVPAKIKDEDEQLACTLLEVSYPPRVRKHGD